MSLDKELETFKVNKEKLLVDKKDRFILIKGNKIISDFASYDDALSDGYKRYGNQEFLVKQVLENDSVNFFTKEFFSA